MTAITTKRLVHARALLVAVLALLLVSSLAGSAGASRESVDGDNALDAQIAAYQRVYPDITYEQARVAAEQQQARKSLYDELSRNGGRDFGGAWFEPVDGVLHVAVTNEAAARRARSSGGDKGLQVTTHTVRRPLTALLRQAEDVRQGKDELSRAADGQIGLDVQTNQVVVAVSEDERERLRRRGVPEGIKLVVDQNIRTEADGCTSRWACDTTLRAGSVLWRDSSSSKVCSLGFTARDSYNRRYVLTAGHCSNGNDVTWGTGAQSIGPMYASIDWNAYDAAIIRNFSRGYADDLGGEIYYNTSYTLDVDYVAPSLSYIWSGDTVCLSANYTDVTGPNYCGVVGTNSDANVRGMVRVDGLDACGGDSGGGWYWLASSSYRVAYGLHSRSDFGCHGSSGGDTSWFSPLPTILDNWAPWLTVETR